MEMLCAFYPQEKNAGDEDRNLAELLVMLKFLNKKCPKLVKILLEKFGEYSWPAEVHGDHTEPTPPKVKSTSICTLKERPKKDIYSYGGCDAPTVHVMWPFDGYGMFSAVNRHIAQIQTKGSHHAIAEKASWCAVAATTGWRICPMSVPDE
eukprot:6104070-Amphidinium_carterae.1